MLLVGVCLFVLLILYKSSVNYDFVVSKEIKIHLVRRKSHIGPYYMPRFSSFLIGHPLHCLQSGILSDEKHARATVERKPKHQEQWMSSKRLREAEYLLLQSRPVSTSSTANVMCLQISHQRERLQQGRLENLHYDLLR